MKNIYESNGIFSMTEKEGDKPKAAKRVNIVSVRLVKESSMLYKRRSIGSPADGYEIFKDFLEDLDRRLSLSFHWTPRISRCRLMLRT